MGKSPNEFVPVKYANETSQLNNNQIINGMVAILFAGFLL